MVEIFRLWLKVVENLHYRCNIANEIIEFFLVTEYFKILFVGDFRVSYDDLLFFGKGYKNIRQYYGRVEYIRFFADKVTRVWVDIQTSDSLSISKKLMNKARHPYYGFAIRCVITLSLSLSLFLSHSKKMFADVLVFFGAFRWPEFG